MNISTDITDVINSFRRLTGVGICFYDLDSFFDYNRLGVQSNRGHYCEFCKSVRLLKDGRTQCDASDRGQAIDLAKKYKKPFFFKCHAGMCELVLPLINGDELIGLVFVGQCRIKNENNAKEIGERITEMGGERGFFLERYDSLPELSRDDLLDMGNILDHYFKILIETAGSNAVQRFITENSSSSIVEKIHSYVTMRYRFNITPGKICEELYLNNAYVSRLFKKETGMTIGEYINKTRIEYAKKLLEGTNVPIGSIALNVGFKDANYFSRVFKRYEGMSPETYRMNAGK